MTGAVGAAVSRAVGVGGAAVVLGATGAVGGFLAAGAGDIRAVLASDGVDGGVGAVAFRAVVAGGAVVFSGVAGAVGGFLWAGAGDIRAVLASDGADGAVTFGDAVPSEDAESTRGVAVLLAAGTFPALSDDADGAVALSAAAFRDAVAPAGAVAFDDAAPPGDAAPPDGAESARGAADCPAAGAFPAALFAVAWLPLPAGVSVVIVTVPSCTRAPDAPWRTHVMRSPGRWTRFWAGCHSNG
ncbi:hypothetical protein ACFWII_28760 [Streptomyces sp. NPDC127063]|uniref:hypothetical protein n=1 Tax=unclassified Streptomyces TaxID=2593676 RepID=UPI003665563A